MNQLAGRRALVVGAGSGIGRAVVEAFVADGARVGALELDAAKCAALERDLAEVAVTCGDALSWPDTQRALDHTVAAHGGLDVLVNCVGVFDFYRGIGDLAPDELDAAFDEMFGSNVRSHLVSVRVALDELVAAKGSVILTASTSSFYPGRGGVLYVASKFAVRGVVLSLAHELAPAVRVNGVAPGGTVGTDLAGLAALGLDHRHLDDDTDRAERLRGRTPLQVALTAADQAGCYVFLASDAARGLTGTFLHPDGGMAART